MHVTVKKKVELRKEYLSLIRELRWVGGVGGTALQ